MSLVNRVYAGHHKTLLIVLYLMFYSYNYNDTREKSYSVAINVPMNQCQGNFDPLNEPFSTLKKNATDVKNEIYNKENQFYKSEDLMAAGPCTSVCKKSETCTSKSVSVLLQNDSSTTFKSFLQRRKDSCVVIYSVYSPCLKMSGVYNIIPNLENLKNHAGIKAFVFKKVYNVDGICSRCSDLAKNFTDIASHVPFYCFENKTVFPITMNVNIRIKNIVKEWDFTLLSPSSIMVKFSNI